MSLNTKQILKKVNSFKNIDNFAELELLNKMTENRKLTKISTLLKLPLYLKLKHNYLILNTDLSYVSREQPKSVNQLVLSSQKELFYHEGNEFNSYIKNIIILLEKIQYFASQCIN